MPFQSCDIQKDMEQTFTNWLQETEGLRMENKFSINDEVIFKGVVSVILYIDKNDWYRPYCITPKSYLNKPYRKIAWVKESQIKKIKTC